MAYTTILARWRDNTTRTQMSTTNAIGNLVQQSTSEQQQVNNNE